MPEGVTVRIGRRSGVYPTPLDAIRALIHELPNEELSGLRLLNMVRAESRHRMGESPPPDAEAKVATQIVGGPH